jgi:hypothetical protein
MLVLDFLMAITHGELDSSLDLIHHVRESPADLA